MSVDSVLDQAFNTLLAKARQRAADATQPPVLPATANFQWSGGGAPIAVAIDPITLVPVPTSTDPVSIAIPFPCSIGFVYMLAGDGAGKPVVVSAQVDVELTQMTAFGSSIALNGTGLAPQLTVASAGLIDSTLWQPNLITGDILIARLTSFTGLATWVALYIQLVPTVVGLGLLPVVDSSANTLTDAGGNTLVLRN